MSEAGLPAMDQGAPARAKLALGCLIVFTVLALLLGGGVWWMLRGLTTDPERAAHEAQRILPMEFPAGVAPIGAFRRGELSMVWAGDPEQGDQGLHMVLLATTGSPEEWRLRASQSGFFQRSDVEIVETEERSFQVRGSPAPAVFRRYGDGQTGFEVVVEEPQRTVLVFLGGPEAEATAELLQSVLDSVP